MNDDTRSSDPTDIPGVAPPEGSSIEILEESAERLVLFIPAGPKRGRELGCFGVMWTTITAIITAGFASGIGQPGGPGAAQLLFLVPFWLAGLLVLYFSLKMRHTRTLLLVEPARAVLQQTFFGRTKTRETTLAPGEPAMLVESYRQNKVPVDAVCLKGDPRPLKFATALETGEKAWIVDRLNAFLGVAPADDPSAAPVPTWFLPETCTSCGVALPSSTAGLQELACPLCGVINKGKMRLIESGPSDTRSAAGEFPSDRVTIDDQTPDVLEFHMRVFENAAMRRGSAVTFALVALVWNSIIGTFVWATLFSAKFNAGSFLTLAFLLPFVAIGLAIAGAAVFIAAGRLRVRLDRETLTASWGVGPLSYSKSFATESITHVTVQNSPLAVKNERPRSRPEDTRTAIVWSGDRWIPITLMQGVNDCRHVAELTRQQLNEMGFVVADRRTPVATDVAEEDEETDDFGADDARPSHS